MLADDLVASDYASGCPLATVALEATVTSEAVRQTCDRYYRGYVDMLAARLAAAGMAAEQAERVSTAALAAIEGAILLCKVMQSPQPLLAVGEMLQATLPERLAAR